MCAPRAPIGLPRSAVVSGAFDVPPHQAARAPTLKSNQNSVVLFRANRAARAGWKCLLTGRNGSNFLSLIPMTTRPERFRVKALECYVAAQKEKDPKTREAYLELMRNWRELADEIEHFEHAWLDREGI